MMTDSDTALPKALQMTKKQSEASECSLPNEVHKKGNGQAPPEQQPQQQQRKEKVDIDFAQEIKDTHPVPESNYNFFSSIKNKDLRWMHRFLELRTFQEAHGHCVVPRGYIPNPKLASWVAEQRKQRKLMLDGKQNSMIPPRLLLLEEIGFVWNAQNAAWMRHMKDLESFQKEHGHCVVPVGCSQYPKLGTWVKEQRRNYDKKSSSMTEERISKLNGIGFCWTLRKDHVNQADRLPS